MKRSMALTSLLLSVGLLSKIAQPAEIASADLTTGFQCVGTISIRGIAGTADDVEQLIAQRADETGASYYRILHMLEEVQPNHWRVTAEIYS